jgi:uncharacterized repeat protein (TIGR04138 family)
MDPTLLLTWLALIWRRGFGWLDQATMISALAFFVPGVVLAYISETARNRRRQRRRSGLCEFCGYDLRGTRERCPECGKVTAAQRRKLAAKKSPRVKADVPCVQCRFNLRDRPIRGECPQCGHSVRRALLEHIATITGHSEAQAQFVWAASSHVFRRMQFSGPGPLKHLTARDFCLGLRDYAIEQSGNPERALILLKDMGFRSSEDIGEIVFGMVGVGLLHARPEDRPEDFVGLFTVDQLFTAQPLV